MRTIAATVERAGDPWLVQDLDVSQPKEGEVLVRWSFAGLCLSDEHGRGGDWDTHLPYVGGHEGAGVVEKVGPGVTRLQPGDHVAACWIPTCGRCRWCSTGRTAMCVVGPSSSIGLMADGGYRFLKDGLGFATFAGVGTFAQRAVLADGSCVKIDPTIPLELAALASCGVLTGWGSAVRAGHTSPGEVVAVVGVGGVGANAVAGAAQAGAAAVIAVDPNPLKHDLAREFGATHTFLTADDAREAAADLNPSAGGADLVIFTAASLSADSVRSAFYLAGRCGRIVLSSMASGPVDLSIPGMDLVGDEKSLIGASYGSCNPHSDIPLVLSMAMAGRLPLQRLITGRFELEDITSGYEALAAGAAIRGLIEHRLPS